MSPLNFEKEVVNEDNKTIAANICREHAKNYGGPSTPAMTVSAIVSELEERDRTIAAMDDVIDDTKRLARELDIAINGEEGAAKQASLCDLISPARKMRDENAALKAQLQEAHKDTFAAAFRENDFKERFYAECKETEALKCQMASLREKLGEAEHCPCGPDMSSPDCQIHADHIPDVGEKVVSYMGIICPHCNGRFNFHPTCDEQAKKDEGRVE